MARTALVVGCSANVWDDVDAAFDLFEPDAVYCIKQAGVHWARPFNVWVSLHPEFMDKYEAQRTALGYPDGYEVVVPPDKELGSTGLTYGKKGRRISYRWPNMKSSASSGIYGAKVALDDGLDRVVLAGIPMSADAGHFLPETRNGLGQARGKVWTQHGAFVCGLNEAIPNMMGRVKSMSGYTKKVLGAPTREWLQDADAALKRLEQRKNEPVEAWANNLASDLGKFKD